MQLFNDFSKLKSFSIFLLNIYNSLSPELKEIAQLRLDNPELSLRALGELTSDKVSRSGVNHRLKKLMSYIDEV